MQGKTAARVAWTALSVFICVAGIGMTFTVLRRNSADIIENAFLVLAFVSIGSVGALIVSRAPHNAIGWLFLSATCLAAVSFAADRWALHTLVTRPGSLPGGAWAAWISSWIWLLFFAPLLTFVPLLFPDGRLASRRWRPVAWATVAGIAAGSTSAALAPGPLDTMAYRATNPAGIEGARGILEVLGAVAFPLLLVSLVLSVTSLILRYRRAVGEERAQFKWFVYGVMILVISFFLNIVLSIPFGDAKWINLLFDLGVVAVPVGAGMAILKHRLFDVDVVISRTIVVGALAVFVTLVYAALVVGIGAAVVGSRTNSFLTLLAAVVIAVAFQPVRARAQHLANRLVFGKRATPYEVLSEFSEHIGGRYGSAEDLLPRMARMVGEGVGARVANVWLRVGGQLQVAGSWPDDMDRPQAIALSDGEVPPIPGADGVYPVRHEGELLGVLSLAKPRGEPLTQTEEKLVGDLAAQAALVLRNVRLIEELRASRQRIVAASDAERRRLERNIHDGAQQQLVAMAMKLRLARDFTRKDLERAVSLLDDVEQDAQSALETLRDLARGIYPPLLADQGLTAALSAQARRAAVPVSVETDGVGRYAQDVEAAAYFCCLEALQNVAKYGGGATATVSLSEQDGTLQFRVADTGVGFDPDRAARGTGLQNMQDRLEALGGTLEVTSRPGSGTTVQGRIPVGVRSGHPARSEEPSSVVHY
jgi:signal transduction histidine kinase